VIRDHRYADVASYPGPRPISEWSDEEVELRTSRYESNRLATLEQLELTDSILATLRAEALRRGMTREEFGRWVRTVKLPEVAR
jgi:hypothetical protein